MVYALDNIDDSIEATKNFLLPFNFYRWTKLALIVFLVGLSNINTNYFPTNTFTGEIPQRGFQIPEIGIFGLTIIAGVLIVIIFFVLIFLFLGSIMEFILAESIRQKEIKIGEYWSKHWKKGLRLFLFRTMVLLLFFIFLGLEAWFIFLPTLASRESFFLFTIFLIPILFVTILFFGLINGLTTKFIVPTMILRDCGLIDGWKRFWKTLKSDWKEYLIYIIIDWLLNIAGGILTFIALFLFVLLLLIPFSILGGMGFAMIALDIGIGIPILIILAIIFIICIFIIGLFIKVPVITYLRYFAFLVLGDTDNELDIIPEQRKKIRK